MRVDIRAISEIESGNENRPEGKRYFIELTNRSILIESDIKNMDAQTAHQNPIGWRLILNTSAIASEIPDDHFYIPIRKVRKEVIDMYEIILHNEDYYEQDGGQGQNGQPQKILRHKTLDALFEYVAKNGKKSKYKAKLNVLKSKQEDDKHFHYSVLSCDFLTQHNSIYSSYPHSGTVRQSYFNPKEEDLLDLEDLSNIQFKSISLTGEQKTSIAQLMNKLSLDKDKPETKEDESIQSLIQSTSGISNILENKIPELSGFALYGPPGNGKTFLIEESLKAIYKNVLNFGWIQVEIGDILSNHYVGGFSANISDLIFKPAIAHVKRNRTPCFVYIDEATDLLKKPEHEWLAQGIETMKSFINKKRYPGIIIGLASNMERKDMDKALTRPGRLKPILIPYPSEERSLQIWKYTYDMILFEKDKGKFLSELSREEQIDKLVYITKNKLPVVAITETTKEYVLRKKEDLHKVKFETFLEHLGEQAIIHIENERDSSIQDIRKFGRTSYVDAEFIKKREEEIETNFSQRRYELSRALDPSVQTPQEAVKGGFWSFFKNRDRVSEKYKRFLEILTNWETIIQSEELEHNPFSLKSISLIKGSVAYSSYLITYLDKSKYNQIIIIIQQIQNSFTEILKIKQNPHLYLNFDMSKIALLFNLIQALPKELIDENEKTSPPTSRLGSGKSSLVLPTDKDIAAIGRNRR